MFKACCDATYDVVIQSSLVEHAKYHLQVLYIIVFAEKNGPMSSIIDEVVETLRVMIAFEAYPARLIASSFDVENHI